MRSDTLLQSVLPEALVQLIEVCRSRANNASLWRAPALVERALLQTGVELSRIGSGASSGALWAFRRGANDQKTQTASARALVMWCPAIPGVRANAGDANRRPLVARGRGHSCSAERTGAAPREVALIADASSTCSHAARPRCGGPRSVRRGKRAGLTAWRIIRPCGHRGHRVRSMPVSWNSWACQSSAPEPLGSAGSGTAFDCNNSRARSSCVVALPAARRP